MNIGEAARHSGLPAKTIRYYEEIGLVRPDRRDNNYRDYGAHALEVLRFLRRSREFGFTIEQCRALLTLYEDPTRCSSQVKAAGLDPHRRDQRQDPRAGGAAREPGHAGASMPRRP